MKDTLSDVERAHERLLAAERAWLEHPPVSEYSESKAQAVRDYHEAFDALTRAKRASEKELDPR